jgi:NDP-sugar pyrophosphorylase family protein
MTDPLIVILAAGASSRMRASAAESSNLDLQLRSDATSKPKSMVGVGRERRPFLEYLLQHVELAGYQQVVIVLGSGGDIIRRHCQHLQETGKFPGLRFSFVTQQVPVGGEKPAGTADALLHALEATPMLQHRKFTVCNSDNLYSVTALRLLLEDSHRNALIDYDRDALRFDRERISRFALLQTSTDGFLYDIIEKPGAREFEEAIRNRGRIGVSMNIFRFSYDDILPFLNIVPLHPVRKEKELPVAVRLMIQEYSHSVYAIPLAEHVSDLTSVADVGISGDYLDDGPDPESELR